MKERPILFSGPMVQAILEGRKTQTRRIIKNQNLVGAPSHGFNAYEVEDIDGHRFWGFSSDDEDWECPFGQPGDRLWVRETWAHDGAIDDVRAGIEDIMGPSICLGPYYGADYQEDIGLRWKPSIHMPRWASRITLEIVSVRVERLQEISEEDAIAEGVNLGGSSMGHKFTAKEHFEGLWQSIYTKEGQTWNDHPWVWVVEFKRIAA